jgi:hypothetical protein
MTKKEFKKYAISLRKKGKTYSDILSEVPVAKSTLSLWLREVGLSKVQKQKITKKRIEAGKRGGAKRHEMRLEKTKRIFAKAKKDINNVTKRDLWIAGVMLYWAEGTKEKESNTGVSLEFGNSDPRMIQLYLKWLDKCLKIERERITFRLFIHENARKDLKKVLLFWVGKTHFPKKHFVYTYFKKHNPKTKRKNLGKTYNGLVMVRVKKSSDLNRMVAGWVRGFIEAV